MTPRARILLCSLGLFVVAVVSVAALKAPPDGIERSDFAQFLGRFHPLAVHLPIAFVLLAAVLELAGFSRAGKHLKGSAGFVLGLAAASALLAIILGWLLAWSGGYHGHLVTRHMWGGVSLTAVLLITCALRDWNDKIFASALVATVALMIWTSDQGGKLTHGPGFLTEHMPATLRSVLHVAPPSPQPTQTPESASVLPAASPESTRALATFFATRVAPIFNDRCVTCHGPEKVKGRLRLDSFAGVMKGGKHGAVIKPGDTRHSELYRRINLPRDDEHAMPGEGKPALSSGQIKVIELWIDSGASQTLAAEEVRGAPPLPVLKPLAPPLTADYRLRLTNIQALQDRLGVRLIPRSQNPRDGLILRAVTAPAQCDDATIEALAPVADLIVDAELARTKITDAGVRRLGTFLNLRAIDISHTTISSQGLAPLANLPKLESLNLTATEVDDRGVLPLRRKPGLRHLFLFETRCTLSSKP
jgi:uncharacterized membrane protein